jgi:hypothetical protein
VTTKQRNFRRRLAAALERAMRQVVGRQMGFDGCVVFQANVHLAVTGIDPIARWRGRYSTRRGMQRIMGRAGVPGCMRQAARSMKWKSIKPAAACIGDVGIVATETGPAVVRKLHRNEWIGRNNGGWTVVPTKDVRLAWAVS